MRRPKMAKAKSEMKSLERRVSRLEAEEAKEAKEAKEVPRRPEDLVKGPNSYLKERPEFRDQAGPVREMMSRLQGRSESGLASDQSRGASSPLEARRNKRSR